MSSITPGIQFSPRITATTSFAISASLVTLPVGIYTADTYTRSASITASLPPLSSVMLGGEIRVEAQGTYPVTISASGQDEIGYRAPIFVVTSVSRADQYLNPITTGGSISATSTVLNAGSGVFVASDIGTWIAISGAGTAGGMHSTTIVSFSTSSIVIISSAAVTTSTSAAIYVENRSVMGVAGDARPRFQVPEQKIIGGSSNGGHVTAVWVSGLTGSASIVALNSAVWNATNYFFGTANALTYLYLDNATISSGATYSSGGTIAVTRQNVTLIAADNYLHLQATLDSDGTTRRWIKQNGTLETIGEGRDVAIGMLPQNYSGYDQDIRQIYAADWFLSGADRRGYWRTNLEIETSDPSEQMVGMSNVNFPYGVLSPVQDSTNTTGGAVTLHILWSRTTNNTANPERLSSNRNSFFVFRAIGLQTTSNSAGRFEFGNTYYSTANDRRTFMYWNEFTNVAITNEEPTAFGTTSTAQPRFGVINGQVTSSGTAQNQTVGIFWAQSTNPTVPVVRFRSTVSSAACRLTQWEWGTTGGNVLAYIDSVGAGAIDTSWTSPATDLAEWKVPWWDGNPQMEDRRARTVVFVDAANPNKPIHKGPKGAGPKVVKLRLWNSFTPRVPHEFICGVTTSNPAYAMGAAPIRYHKKYLTDKYGSVLSEEADFVEWAVITLRMEGKDERKVMRERVTIQGFVDEMDEIPPKNLVELGDVVAEMEAEGAKGEIRVWTSSPTFSKQFRPQLNPAYDASRPYQPRPERAEWFRAGIVEKGMVPLHDDEPILSEWWVLGEAGPGLIWVSI